MKSLNSKPILFSLVVTALLMMGCGSKKVEASSDSTDQASRITSTTGSTGPRALAYCNQTADPTTGVTVNMAALLDSSGHIDTNYVHLKLTNVPDSFTDNSHYFALWKWYAQSNGYSYTDPTPLTFKIVKIETNEEISAGMTNLSWSSVSSLASSLGATTPSQFFQKVRLYVFVDDSTGKFEALTIGYHNATSGVADNRIDSLMPVFDADPNVYATSHPSVLLKIHPFANVDHTGWTSADYVNKSNEFCAPLSQH